MRELKVREAVLKNGEKITGTIVPIYPAKILLQTDDMCLELLETEIHSLDGKEDFRNLIEPPESAIFESTIVYRYNEDGSAISFLKHKSMNNSDQVLGKISILRTSKAGRTEELERQFKESEHFDTFGNLLPFAVDEVLEDGWKYSTELLIPVAPGDSYEMTYKHKWPGWAEKENDHWIARHHGGCTADVIFTLMLILPQGAKFSSATPQPLRQFDFNGRPTVTWKRYMPKDESVTFEARYKL